MGDRNGGRQKKQKNPDERGCHGGCPSSDPCFRPCRSIFAAERLAADKVDVAVLHVPTVKPLDVEAIVAEAGKGRLVVTAENHTENGGLGEAVAKELLKAGVTPTFRMIALPDAFLEAGALPTLHDMYGLSVGKVAERIKGWL